MKRNNIDLFSEKIIREAIKNSFLKLNPLLLIKNPVIFIVGIGATLSTIILINNSFNNNFSAFEFQIAIWLWFTVIFANFAESIAEGRGKAQAESLRKSKKILKAKKTENGIISVINSSDLRKGDIVICDAGDIIPSDGEVTEGIATVDESAITGESAPVIREAGGDRSAVTGGTTVLSDKITIKITADSGNTFIDKLIHLVENARRQKTPNEISLTLMLAGLSIIFLLTVFTLPFFTEYADLYGSQKSYLSIPVLISLLVCLIPTTIGGLLSAIGISGMDRLIKKNVIAMSGKAIEAAGDLDILLLDKTGTITLGNRMATEFIPIDDKDLHLLARAAMLSSISDETPEGRSILKLAKENFGIKSKENIPGKAKFIPFSAESRMSGINLIADNRIIEIRKGAYSAISEYMKKSGKSVPGTLNNIVNNISQNGGTPLVVCEDKKVLGVIKLKDIVKGGIKERFAQLRKMGIKTIMITGDNNLTAAAIAAEAGVDDFLSEAKPEDKLKMIRNEQEKGHLVGMIGDGTNDAPALAQSDVGIAMNTGTQAAREAGNMIDLDSNPTKLIEVVETGKQLLMTRGALTTFSIANDVAKYFAILPALFLNIYSINGFSPLSILNIMDLKSPESAILSAVIFNAIIIVLLIPLALKGIKYKPMEAAAVLRKNLLIYGIGGLIVPFLGIKIIDIFINTLNLI